MADQSGEEKTREMVASTGYCYTDHDSSTGNQNIQTHLVSQLQPFEHSSEIYNLTAGMEMIGFPPKNLHQQNENTSLLWKEFFNKPGGGASTSKPTSTSEFYSHDLTNENLMDSSSAWNNQNRLMVDDPSLRCVFPGEGNERRLSLSLSSSNPGIHQSFDLGQQQDDLRFGPSSSRSVVNTQRQQEMMQQQFHIRNSNYLAPAQDLLNEFCNLGSKHSENTSKQKIQKNNEWDDENIVKKQSLYSLDILELQKRKTKLLQLLEEVDRRYKHYCDQMKAVVSSFEAVAGNGAATVYSALASKAMSRHFRRLRDGIVWQIKATMKAMGAKDTAAAPGTTRGETPRLRLLDQTLRQQRAFQQMNIMESHPWRPQRGLPERSVTILRAWLFEHFLHPYPSDVDKHILARQTGLSRSQVSNWFINARVRLWKPMVEQMYLEELKEKEGLNDDSTTNLDENSDQLNSSRNIDEKPNHDQLVRIDSECLSSIVNNPEKNDGKKSKTLQNDQLHQQHHSFGRVRDSSFGAVELDFSSYNHHSAGGAHNYVGSSGGGGGGGVSLTLGLHHASVGASLAFSSASQNSFFYPRDHIEDCQTVQYSLLDSESQNLPYRNLMGAQLLHDLAG